jgi:hypothetical protein
MLQDPNHPLLSTPQPSIQANLLLLASNLVDTEELALPQDLNPQQPSTPQLLTLERMFPLDNNLEDTEE